MATVLAQAKFFAGAIHDHNRGTVVGQTSYGKGSVQGVFHNDHGNGGLRLTVSKFFSPKGTPISARGVQPHIVVEENDPNERLDITALKPATTDSKRFVSKTNTKPDLAKDRAVIEARRKINFGR